MSERTDAASGEGVGAPLEPGGNAGEVDPGIPGDLSPAVGGAGAGATGAVPGELPLGGVGGGGTGGAGGTGEHADVGAAARAESASLGAAGPSGIGDEVQGSDMGSGNLGGGKTPAGDRA